MRAPEGNGCAERFIHTLKENLLWVRGFGTVEELRELWRKLGDGSLRKAAYRGG